MKKLIAAAGIAAGLGLGGFAVGSVLPVGASTPSETTPTTTPSTPDGARGTAGTITVNALLQTQANGTVRVAFETTGAGEDPGMGARVSDSYLRRVAR